VASYYTAAAAAAAIRQQQTEFMAQVLTSSPPPPAQFVPRVLKPRRRKNKLPVVVAEATVIKAPEAAPEVAQAEQTAKADWEVRKV
jgi:hypothetical protein